MKRYEVREKIVDGNGGYPVPWWIVYDTVKDCIIKDFIRKGKRDAKLWCEILNNREKE